MPPIVQLHVNANASSFLNPIQSIDHYMGRAELFEFQLSQPEMLILSTPNPCFFLFVNIIENTCQMCFHPGGSLQVTLSSGEHKIMVITYYTNWFLYKCKLLNEISCIADSISKPKQTFLSLPSIRMAKSLLKVFRKMKHHTDPIKLDRACYLFINDSVNGYDRRIKSHKETVAYNQQKAEEIAKFVIENYASEVVDDRRKLADHFMVSERNLDRLAKSAFGIPLHAQVIKYRMGSGLDQLLNTQKPIYEIAELSGYRESHYFSKAFKHYFGVSPTNLIKG